MSDFSDRPFVAGQLVGLRSFKVTDARLQSVYHVNTWTTGESTALCMNAKVALLAATLHATNGVLPGWLTPAQRALIREGPHQPAHLGCECGLYAYFDRLGNPHHFDQNVVGVIAGWGRCVVGTRGFRAEKARLLALVIPAVERDTPRTAALLPNYPGIPVFTSMDGAVEAFPLTPPAPVKETA